MSAKPWIADYVTACVRACEGMDDPVAEIQAMREALRALVDACTHPDGSISPEPRSRGDWLQAMADAHAVIAKAQDTEREG